MSKLPPPYVDTTIPAQTGSGLSIPFQFNRAVSLRDVTKVYIKIKTIATDRILGVFETTSFAKSDTEAVYIASFDAPVDSDSLPILTIGQFYKFQLAFGDNKDQQGYFSTVGVFKYTSTPQVYIENLQTYEIGNLYTYTGVYDQTDGDPTEKEYSYQFNIYNGDDLFATSGLLLHDSTTDEVDNKSFNTWVLNQQLVSGVIYTLTYTVNTINGISKTCQYNITNNEIEDNILAENYILSATNDFDNGRIILNLKAKNKISLTGGFVVSRSSDKDNYQIWNEILKFTLLSHESLPENLFTDYTVEQGVNYRYAIQRYNDSGFYSARVLTESPIIADFEDMFLYDGSRQLKVRFDPKVTSFKENILETKTDTIGGRYPFFFRNGDVKYKEFPLSGLISHLSDEQELFMSATELGLLTVATHRNEQVAKEVIRSTQLDALNTKAERIFKLNVLDWLTNGQPKIFRSPQEGNYIVRLLNTSLSPNETVGRMLHTFSSTAYEIDEFNFVNLIKYKFVEDYSIDNRVLLFHSIPLNSADYRMQQNYLRAYNNGVYQAEFIDVAPGTLFHLQFLDGNGIVPIVIPINGYYKVNIFNAPLVSIKCIAIPEHHKEPRGMIDIGYYSTAPVGDFGPVRKVSIVDRYLQVIGKDFSTNILRPLINIKKDIGRIYTLTLKTKTDELLYYYNNSYYRSYKEINGEKIYDDEVTSFIPTKLYYIENYSDSTLAKAWWFAGNLIPVNGKPPRYSKGETIPSVHYKCIIKLKNYDEEIIMLDGVQSAIRINNIGQLQYIPESGHEQTIYDLDNVEKITIGNGIILDMVYQEKELIYGIEEDDIELAQLKETNYELFLQQLADRLE